MIDMHQKVSLKWKMEILRRLIFVIFLSFLSKTELQLKQIYEYLTPRTCKFQGNSGTAGSRSPKCHRSWSLFRALSLSFSGCAYLCSSSLWEWFFHDFDNSCACEQKDSFWQIYFWEREGMRERKRSHLLQLKRILKDYDPPILGHKAILEPSIDHQCYDWPSPGHGPEGPPAYSKDFPNRVKRMERKHAGHT